MEALQLDAYPVDVSTGNFLVRGQIQPRGDLFTYLNDRSRASYPIVQAQFMADGPEYKVSAIKQASITVTQAHIAFMALLNEEDAAQVQFVQASRPVVFYTNWFAMRGNLHVHGEARDDDLMEPTKDFFAVTEASVYPIRPNAHAPHRHYPLLALNRKGIVGYHIYQAEEGT